MFTCLEIGNLYSYTKLLNEVLWLTKLSEMVLGQDVLKVNREVNDFYTLCGTICALLSKLWFWSDFAVPHTASLEYSNFGLYNLYLFSHGPIIGLICKPTYIGSCFPLFVCLLDISFLSQNDFYIYDCNNNLTMIFLTLMNLLIVI